MHSSSDPDIDPLLLARETNVSISAKIWKPRRLLSSQADNAVIACFFQVFCMTA